jgi:hypothetical protein
VTTAAASFWSRELEVPEGLGEDEPAARGDLDRPRLDAPARARVDREDDRGLLGDAQQGREERGERGGVVDVRRAVQSRQHVGLGQAGQLRRLGDGQQAHQGVDHHVADAADAGGVHAFLEEIGVPVGGGREEELAQAVGDDPVDLLGHRAVEGAQAGLDVRGRDEGFGGYERRRHRRVDVAVEHHEVGRFRGQQRLEARHHLGGLRGVGARAPPGCGQAGRPSRG